jgi:hypothetical protein
MYLTSNTSKMFIEDTIKLSVFSIAGAKKLVLGPSVKYSSHPEESIMV